MIDLLASPGSGGGDSTVLFELAANVHLILPKPDDPEGPHSGDQFLR